MSGSHATLDLETMRADVADVLRVDVEQITDGVNLMDLGLDSIRVMVLAQRWTEAVGTLVHVAPLAERPELAAWWRHVSSLAS